MPQRMRDSGSAVSDAAAYARAGERSTVCRGDSPFVVDADVDPDAPAPDHWPLRVLLIFDSERAARQVEEVLPQIDAKRLGEVPGASTQIVQRDLGGAF